MNALSQPPALSKPDPAVQVSGFHLHTAQTSSPAIPPEGSLEGGEREMCPWAISKYFSD
jgi:hypothetical protein